MRLSILPLVLAAAGLAQYATASALRVVIVSSHGDVNASVMAGGPPSARIAEPGLNVVAPQFASANGNAPPHFCNKFKNKALELTNKFRATFGLPTIAATPGPVLVLSPPRPSHGLVEILPVPKFNTPIFIPEERITQPRKGVVRGGCHRSFVHRIHRALMILGPWEGRAVAFVLGCGIGVLLRMFWVMTILIARSFRGRSGSEEEDVQHILVFERDAEEIYVAPPSYTDEKAPLPTIEADKKDTTA